MFNTFLFRFIICDGFNHHYFFQSFLVLMENIPASLNPVKHYLVLSDKLEQVKPNIAYHCILILE